MEITGYPKQDLSNIYRYMYIYKIKLHYIGVCNINNILCSFDHRDSMLGFRSACMLTGYHVSQLITREVVVTKAMKVLGQVDSFSYTGTIKQT